MPQLTLLVAVLAWSASAWPQSEAVASPAAVRLDLGLSSETNVFRRGEVIPLELTFRASEPKQYQIDLAQYDCSGRLGMDSFMVSPAEGTSDPLRAYFGSLSGYVGGGLRGFQFLSEEPVIVRRELNEWIRFDRTGTYRLSVVSRRVSDVRAGEDLCGKAVEVRSNEVEFHIIEGDAAWQKQKLADILPTLDKKNEDAFKALRYLGSEEAALETARRLRGEEPGTDWHLAFGLIGSPHRDAALLEMERLLSDPDFPVSAQFLMVLSILPLDLEASPDRLRADREQNAHAALMRLVEALPQKKGKAAAASVDVALAALTKDTPEALRSQLVAQLIRSFEELPPARQAALLRHRWDLFASPQVLPVLRRLALQYQHFEDARAASAWDSLDATGTALRRWYELDPEGAGSAVLAEIGRAEPRYGASVLGLLPDKSLPGVEQSLAAHFVRPDNSLDTEENLASLLARYATAAVLPQVVPKIERLAGIWACAPQNSALAYVLKVDPATARLLIERAMAARGPEKNGCRRQIFTDIGQIHTDPVLEDLALQGLNNEDPEVAANAARYLGRHGSAGAEIVLWRRYEAWSRQWAGRASELRVIAAAKNLNVWQANLGQALAQALATGEAWLADRPKLRGISGLSVTEQMRVEAAQWLDHWNAPQHAIVYIPTSPATFHVAQYQLDSLEALENKLSQFPAGTEFRWTAAEREISEVQEQSFQALAAWAREHGVALTRQSE